MLIRLLLILSLFFSSLNNVYALQVVPDSFAELSAKTSPAVVNISTSQKLSRKNQQMGSLFPNGSPFEEFNELFERFGLLPPGIEPEDSDRTISSLGSGFIIDAKGYIVTNQHVIADADKIMVTLNDDSKYEAQLIGSDPKTDLALLKITSNKNLPYLSLANSDEAKVGDWIIAIGNPFGLGGSVTAGIISAKSRDIQAGSFDEFIQTDAAINRGNSGGPMINMKGQVVGINTAIYSPSGGSVGIGFAIPSSLAYPIIEQLKINGKVRRGWLGVTVHPVTPDIADSVGLKEPKGAIVTEVTPGGPADKYGIRPGDIILKFNNKNINSSRNLPRLVAGVAIGANAEIEVFRNGTIATVHIKVGENPSESEIKALSKDKKSSNVQEILGLNVTDLTLEMKQELGIDPRISGVLITKIIKNGKAYKHSLQRGDIILQVNQQAVTSTGIFEKLVNKAIQDKKGSLLVLLMRNNQKYYVGINLDK